MALEKVNYEVKVFGSHIEIIPTDKMKDNSLYEIKLNNLKTTSNQSVPDQTISFLTAFTPMYCAVTDVKTILSDMEIDDTTILYNIRAASRYADYIYEQTYHGKKIKVDKGIPFEVSEFTRFRAAKDCLLKVYMSLASDNIVSGALGDVNFKLREDVPDLSKLLKYLDEEIDKWKDAIRGYHLEGRSRMTSAIRGYHHGGINPMYGAERREPYKSVPLRMDRGVR